MKDGKEYPIGFLSKTLNKIQLRWSTIEKEAYAIIYAFSKFEHLIRDIKFTLRTDHKNLTFINIDHREKVKRWKLSMQHFDFDIEHIAGELNVVADGLSRLCQYPVASDKKNIHEIHFINNMINISNIPPMIGKDKYLL